MSNELERWRAESPELRLLIQALTSCEANEELLEDFLIELLTPHELKGWCKRWLAATILLSGEDRNVAAEVSDLSIKTVNNVHKWTMGDFSRGASREIFLKLKQSDAETL